MNRAKELAEQHWDYIRELLETHNVPGQEIEIIGFHYKTAMVHGYKHALEDSKTEE